MAAGCTLAGARTNIIGYADDISLLAPSAAALQELLDTLSSHLDELGLKINVEKCAYLIFRKNAAQQIATNVIIKGKSMEKVETFKYLGVILSTDNSISADTGRALTAFLKQFNAIYHKFHYTHDPILQFLFRTYTSSFYGAELWYGSSRYKNINGLAVSYHKAVKRVARMNVWDSNHLACEIVGVPIFKHLIARRALCFFFKMMGSPSPCIIPYKYFIRHSSHMAMELKTLFLQKYDVPALMENPLCALLARINFVEKHEPRRTRAEPAVH